MRIKVIKRGEPERVFSCSDITSRNIPNTQDLVLEFCLTEIVGSDPVTGEALTTRRTVETVLIDKEGDVVYVMDDRTGNTVDCYRYRIHGPAGTDREAAAYERIQRVATSAGGSK